MCLLLKLLGGKRAWIACLIRCVYGRGRQTVGELPLDTSQNTGIIATVMLNFVDLAELAYQLGQFADGFDIIYVLQIILDGLHPLDLILHHTAGGAALLKLLGQLDHFDSVQRFKLQLM